jgi:hypothetical protein
MKLSIFTIFLCLSFFLNLILPINSFDPFGGLFKQDVHLEQVAPTDTPSSIPSNKPSVVPTDHPTINPSSQPSAQPTRQPSSQPVGDPTSIPSSQPVADPSSQPSDHPSGSPTSQPSSLPTSNPTLRPCNFCVAGTYYKPELCLNGPSNGCVNCPMGYSCAGGCEVPQPCGIGSYQPTFGQSACVTCPAGTFNLIPGQQ